MIESGADLELRDVTVTGGSALANGGGIDSSGGRLTLEGVRVIGNHAPDFGGGVFVGPSATQLTIRDSAISGNSADAGTGAGAGIQTAAPATITDSEVIGNTGGEGVSYVAVLPDAGDVMTINRSTVSGNTSTNGAGGVFFLGKGATILRSTVSDNSGDRGGGLWVGDGSVRIAESTVSGNVAATEGGGILVSPATGTQTPAVELRNATVADNEAPTGDGLLMGSNDTARYSGTIFDGNGCLAVHPGVLASENFNLESGDTCALTEANDLPSTDPVLGPLADNGGPTLTHAIAATSPARDAVGTGLDPCLLTGLGLRDQRDFARPAGPRCDIGAFEFHDADGDSVEDGLDNCPGTANSTQTDSDGDGIGNACDPSPLSPSPDGDGDGRSAPDTTDPELLAKARKRQRAGRPVKVKLVSDEDADVLVAGKVIVRLAGGASTAATTAAARKRKKKIGLRRARAELTAGEKTVLKLRPKGKKKKAKRKLRRIRRLVGDGAKAKAKLRATATDQAGNSDTAKVKVKLKR